MTKPLPTAIKGQKEDLSKEELAEVYALNGANLGQFMFQLAGAWAVIAAAVAFAVGIGTWWAYALAIPVISTRHNVLGLLLHEQTHYLGFGSKSRWGDLITNLLVGYPLLIMSVEEYAQVHLLHHRDYHTESDFDFKHKSGQDWKFPKTHGQMIVLFCEALFGINIIRFLFTFKRRPAMAAFVRRHPTPWWVRPSFLRDWPLS